MGLYHDQVESHVCPGELGELESIMAFLKRANEEHEACSVVSRVLPPTALARGEPPAVGNYQ